MSTESVFICYRRADTEETAGRIFDSLNDALPKDAVFWDIDSIPLGIDFRSHVRQKLAGARVILVLIGPEWLTIRDKQNRRRLDSAADHVRVEVEMALQTKGARVIPLLCRKAEMPGEEDLPACISALAFMNGQEVRAGQDFRRDMAHLVNHIRRILDEPVSKEEPPAGDSPRPSEEEKVAPSKDDELRALWIENQRVLGEEHPDTLFALGSLACELYAQGKYADAEKEFRALLAARERQLGAEHPDTLMSRSNLGLSLTSQARYAEAEVEHRAVLTIRTRVLEKEHASTLGSWSNLALALRLQGKFLDAEKELRVLLAIQERVFGTEHSETLESRESLASALQAQGKLVDAEKEYRAVLANRERVLGPEHALCLSSRDNVAWMLSRQSKFADAEKEYRALLAIWERLLGPGHPNVIRTCYNLAITREGQKNLAEALDFARRAETGYVKVHGPDHKDSKDSRVIRERIEAALKK